MPNPTLGGNKLTFSKKNQDVRKIIDSKKLNDSGFVLTDYVCEAIRFFENSKENNLEQKIERIVDEKLSSKLLEIVMNGNYKISNKSFTKEEKDLELEKNLDEVDIEED